MTWNTGTTSPSLLFEENHDNQRPGIDRDKYRTLALDRRDGGILFIAIAEPEGCPPASLARSRTEVSWIWRDFDDDPGLRAAVITGRGNRFWAVEGDDGAGEILQDPGDYGSVVALAVTSGQAQ